MPSHFTLTEAETLLPRLTTILAAMQDLKAEHDSHQAKLTELGMKMKSNGHLLETDPKQAREGMARAAKEIERFMHEISDLGCELKDMGLGLIDFRAERDGREVYLCWKLGEPRIGWWHDLHTGFASRQPLD